MQWLKNCGKVSGALMRESGAQTACRWGWDADFCNEMRQEAIASGSERHSSGLLHADTVIDKNVF